MMFRSVPIFLANFSLLSILGLLAADLPSDFQPVQAPGQFFAAKPGETSRHPFQTGTPIVSTSYFYWYDIDSKSHFRNHDDSDAMTTHPATTEGMSWKNPRWHEKQFRQMTEVGIDVALPVYWGTPVAKQPGAFGFSDEGVPRMIEALDAIIAGGGKAPTLGMFYDTSTLEMNSGAYRVDLTTDAGKRWFYATIRNFFSMVPPKHRATIDGKPLVFLYEASYAKNVDETLFPTVREMFRKDFGSDLYLVKTPAWHGDADSLYQWGGAVSFLILDVAAIGPGYDHSAVPGRPPGVRSREEGLFYTLGWERLLKLNPEKRPFLVHLETWNEFHEGTDIGESKEYGTQYLDMTKQFAGQFHAKEQIHALSVSSKYPEPSATPDAEFGIVAAHFPEEGDGVRSPGDGPIQVIEIDENGTKMKVWTTITKKYVGNPREHFFYFGVDPTFLLEHLEAVELTVVYRLGPNAEPDSFAVHYDSYHPGYVGIDQAFRKAKPVKMEQKEGWNTAVFRLSEPRLEKRAHGYDFRLFAVGDNFIVKKISLRHL
jgi:hypothetical protein